MKNNAKRIIAVVMTLIMVAALLPVTASAEFCAILIVNMKQQYDTEESLLAALPEINPEVVSGCHHCGGGTLFEIYYDVQSEEEGLAVEAGLRANPLVREAYYCKSNHQEQVFDPSSAAFEVYLVDSYFPIRDDDWDDYTAELGKLFPEIEIINAFQYGGWHYRIECAASTWEGVEMIYSILQNNPFVSSVVFCEKNSYDGHYRPIGRFTVHLKGRHTPEEVKELLSEVDIIDVYERYEGFQFDIFINATTITETVEAINRVKMNPNIVYMYWITGYGNPCIAPNDMDERYYTSYKRPEVTVATALGALRIAAQLTEVRNDVYDYKLADAIWQYDCDGDKEITVSDALRLLRKAAGLA